MNRRPDTMKEAVQQLWDDVRGTNGAGLIKVARDNRNDIVDMKTDIGYIKGTMESMSNNKPSRKTITKQRIIEIVIGFATLGLVAGGVLLILVEKLDIQDLVEILRALPK